ncbi:hypothetical protein FITA111629_11625 [Filibacter tadaridae]|uniref:Uncharacterized protein n=1 Tax=Filibacter tadaridae TaxID=2483811 RepID=A0A3P5WHA1_9BACL|nr:hypothetical protein [Filibacter tadaridae]VDC21048.1 hypothetical protein FILTAD_00522 [Filibacter tadaridae]
MLVTKSKNDHAVIWSIIAIIIAGLSIGYCFSHIIELIGNGMERSSRAIAYLARLMKGSV